jgi:type I restriction enzyme S subunit
MELKPGYKQTEVGVIPEDWESKRLGEAAEVVMGQSPAGTSYNHTGNGAPLINGPTEFTDRHPIKIQWTTAPTKLCRKGDVLLCVRGSSTGRINISDDEYCIGRGIAAIRAKSEADTRFITFQVDSAVKKILSLTVGSTFPNIDGKSIRAIPIPLPLPHEQQAIAGALSDVDALLGVLEKLIAKKRDLKPAAMQQLPTGQKRLPGFTGKWETKKVGELLNYERPDKYIVKSTDYQENAMTPVLTANKSFVLGYTSEDFGIYSNLPAIIFDDFTTDSKYVDFPFKIKSSAIKILKNRSPSTNLKFVYERMRLIQFPLGEHKRYYISEFQHIEIPTPEPNEQIAIAEVLSDMDTELAALEQRLAKTRALKQGMMQELLTGRIRLI